MSDVKVDIIQLSKSTVAVTFSKNALAAIKDGASTAVQLNVGNRTMKFVFMRDMAFQERYNQFLSAEKQQTARRPLSSATRFFSGMATWLKRFE